MHDRAGWSFKFSDELTGEIKTFAGTYNKDECAFGFFESLSPLAKPKKTKTIMRPRYRPDLSRSERTDDERRSTAD